jgi:hypothetical protein
MSDQADSLRQLVRAQRLWREHTPREPPVVVSRPRFPDAFLVERGTDTDRPRLRGIGIGIGVFMARAARWAFARAGGGAE